LTKAVYPDPVADGRPAIISVAEAAIVAGTTPAVVAQAISARILPRRKDGSVMLADALRFRDDLRPAPRAR
jgi:hypothetical protein